jgi:hypothetical protein
MSHITPAVPIEVLSPKPPRDRVVDGFKYSGAKTIAFIRFWAKDCRHVAEACSWQVEQPEDGLAKQMLRTVAEAACATREGPYEFICAVADSLGGAGAKRIPTGYPLRIAKIDVDDLLDVLLRYQSRYPPNKPTAWIQYSQTVPPGYTLDNQRLHHGGFSRSRDADQANTVPSSTRGDAHLPAAASNVAHTDR